MLRTSLRNPDRRHPAHGLRFLSSNAQDFIEDRLCMIRVRPTVAFLSSNAQDFIEERKGRPTGRIRRRFLSSNAQDFIEDGYWTAGMARVRIPEQ